MGAGGCGGSAAMPVAATHTDQSCAALHPASRGGPTSVDSLAVNSTTGKPDYSYIAVTSSLTPKWGFVHLAATKLRLTLRAVPVDLTQNAGTPVTYTGSYAPLAPIDEITILARPHGPRQKGRPASASAVHAG